MFTHTRMRFLLSLALLFVALSFAAAQTKKPPPPQKPLDLNAASVEQLQTLPTIGPVTAKAIVRFREKSGPFRRVEDLLAVPGFTKKRLAKIRPYITVNPRSIQQGSKPQEGTKKTQKKN